MTKNNNLWVCSLKVLMMSAFATVVSFMLNCLVVVVASGKFNAGDAVGTRIIMQAIGLIVEFIFIYGTLWDIGHTDRQKINIEGKKYSIYRGALIGLISAVPYYLVAGAMLLMTLDIIPDITGLLRSLCSQFWGVYTFLLPVAETSKAASDPTIAQSAATPLGASLAVVVPTIIPILCHLPYKLGRKDVAVGERFFYKSKNKKK